MIWKVLNKLGDKMVKESVLKKLEENQGSNVSGGEISRELGVSRNAVWKAINSLRDEGYNIISSANHGYQLSIDDDSLSMHRIQSFLTTTDIGKDIQIFKSIDSTNTYGMNLTNALHGTIIISEEQTSGKGRLQRSFFSPKNSGIYLSVLLKPQISLDDMGFLTIAGCLAVCHSITELTGLKPTIKWVNDVLLNGKKVCGILTQAKVEGESGRIDQVVLGIGINVNKGAFPLELKEIATSIEENIGYKCSRNKLVALILNNLDKYLQIIYSSKASELIDEYRTLLGMLGRKIDVIQNGKSFIAEAIDINEKGNLIVNDENGNQLILHSGEISIRTK